MPRLAHCLKQMLHIPPVAMLPLTDKRSSPVIGPSRLFMALMSIFSCLLSAGNMLMQSVAGACSCCLNSLGGAPRSQGLRSGSKGPHHRKAPMVTAPVILRLVIYFFCSLYVGWLFRVSRNRPGGILCGLLPLLPVCTSSVVLGAEHASLTLAVSSQPVAPAPPRSRAGERLLFMLSSFDRGERIANWNGEDKMHIILQVVGAARELCEAGYDVTVYVLSAWPSSEQRHLFEDALLCYRTPNHPPPAQDPPSPSAAQPSLRRGLTPIPLFFRDHWNTTIGGKLAYQHRWLVEEQLSNFDYFISIEDDMRLTSSMVEAYRHHTELLSQAGERGRRFLPGFIRYEENTRWHNRSHCIWEGSAEEFGVEQVGGVWYVKTHSFSNQAMWMATRQQVEWFHANCNERFLRPSGPGWVEYWSGGLQLYEQCKLRKVLPLDEFPLFTLQHLTNNKLYHRGEGVTQVADVVTAVTRLRDQCLRQGVKDSNLLSHIPETTEGEAVEKRRLR